MRVVVTANISGRPNAGGHICAVTSWIRGLRLAGHEATLVDSGPDAIANSGSRSSPADVLLCIMGATPPGHRRANTSVYLDIDPGYPQMWRELHLADTLAGHDLFVTLGSNIGRHDCPIPTCGRQWVTSPPPVPLDDWPVTAGGVVFTTVATWRNPYGTVNYHDRIYGSRVHEFRRFLELPRLVDAEFELALDINPAEVSDLRALNANGWRLVDPAIVAGTPDCYRGYIQQSLAEFCVAQEMYVATRSGWLSDRSVCYLASGKPVLAQETGFSNSYPVGEGLLSFSNLDEAAAGVEEIERNYARHSKAARGLAEEYFSAERVVTTMLDRLGLHPAGART